MPHSSWGGCQPARVDKGFAVPTRHGLTRFPQGIRVEATELLYRLVRETDMRGYAFGVPGDASYGCWGYYCRNIGSSGQVSYHSTCAVDINAPRNPQGSRLITDMPDWMPDLWNAYGFRWGGDYKTRPDAMHYEFLGSLSELAQMTQIARAKRLGEDRGAPPPPIDKPKRKGYTMDRLVMRASDTANGGQWPRWLIGATGGKRKLRNRGEQDHFLNTEAFFGGGTIIAGANGPEGPIPYVWADEDVDNVADVAANQVDDTLKWYAYMSGGQSPLHDVVREVMRDDLQETPDRG